ncbi:MAG TPA: DUF4097 family beta strand repeat-containing protein [Balneolaceae bacterium]|nr:DUF4097 family beta strand repeat-containing protein [Balneolaceae bacterium]
MKMLKKIIPILVAVFLLPALANAQERVVIPLTNPGEPGSLSVEVIMGSVSVTGYDGKEVIIKYSGGQMKEEPQKVTEEGLRRISDNAIGFEVTEENNHVEIEGSPMQSVDFEISVPRNFSLNLSSVNGSLHVQDVAGEIELEAVNGEVSLRNINGSALVNTVNGNITAVFDDVPPNKPMAFTNLNGDIDITLPANASFNAKMKSEWGEVYTNFEMNIRTEDKPKSSTDDGIYKVSVNNWIYGTVNGGGPEYLFKSLRGDIYIRKK